MVASLQEIVEIPAGYKGTAATIAAMQHFVTEAKKDYWTAKIGAWIIQGCPYKNYLCHLQKLCDYIVSSVAFVPDPQNIEMVLSWAQTIYRRAGDCDDQAVVLSSLAESIGFRTFFKTIKEIGKGDNFSHVYNIVVVDNKMMPVDLTERPFKIGWECREGKIDSHFQLWPATE